LKQKIEKINKAVRRKQKSQAINIFKSFNASINKSNAKYA